METASFLSLIFSGPRFSSPADSLRGKKICWRIPVSTNASPKVFCSRSSRKSVSFYCQQVTQVLQVSWDTSLKAATDYWQCAASNEAVFNEVDGAVGTSAAALLDSGTNAISSAPPALRKTPNGGYMHTPESKAKISAANKGKVPWNKGRHHTEETKRKIAERTREVMHQPEMLERMRLLQLGRKHSEETRMKIKLTLNSPEVRAKLELARLRRYGPPKPKPSPLERKPRKLHTETSSEPSTPTLISHHSHSDTWTASGNQIGGAFQPMRSHSVEALLLDGANDIILLSVGSGTVTGDPPPDHVRESRRRKKSEEARRKLSASIREKWKDPEYRAKHALGMRNALMGRKLSEEHKQKIRETLLARNALKPRATQPPKQPKASKPASFPFNPSRSESEASGSSPRRRTRRSRPAAPPVPASQETDRRRGDIDDQEEEEGEDRAAEVADDEGGEVEDEDGEEEEYRPAAKSKSKRSVRKRSVVDEDEEEDDEDEDEEDRERVYNDDDEDREDDDDVSLVDIRKKNRAIRARRLAVFKQSMAGQPPQPEWEEEAEEEPEEETPQSSRRMIWRNGKLVHVEQS